MPCPICGANRSANCDCTQLERELTKELSSISERLHTLVEEYETTGNIDVTTTDVAEAIRSIISDHIHL